MNTLTPRLSWSWPHWFEELASRSPDPDRLAEIPSPAALDWILHGLPSDPDHAQGFLIIRALGGLEAPPVFHANRYSPPPPPAWSEGELLGLPSAPDFSTLSPDQRLEVAFLVLLCRGADPWSWRDTTFGVPVVPLRLLGELFSRRLLVAARAMFDHPSCPPLIETRESMAKVREPGGDTRSLSLVSGLALSNDIEGMDLIIQKGGYLRGVGNDSPLACIRSREMAQKILESRSIRAYDVFHALISWLSPGREFPHTPALIPDSIRSEMILEAQGWWQKEGLGGEGQWAAQLACMKAIVHGGFSNSSFATQEEMDTWIREVGSFPGNIWLPDHKWNSRKAFPRRTKLLHGMGATPSSTVNIWLTDRSQDTTLWSKNPGELPPGESWYWQNRIERLEVWKRLERGLGESGRIAAWERVWGRFWSWVPPLTKWSEEDARQAARLWKMEHRPCHWPPPEWALDDMGPKVLGSLPAPVRKIVGEAFALSIVESALVKEGAPHLTAGMGSKEWWGFRVRERMRWLESWLETPGWEAPFLDNEREQVLLCWPVGKAGKSPGEIASIWASRAMTDVLDIPEPRSALPRSRF